MPYYALSCSLSSIMNWEHELNWIQCQLNVDSVVAVQSLFSWSLVWIWAWLWDHWPLKWLAFNFFLANTDPASLHSKKSQEKYSPVYHVNMKDISSLIFLCLYFDLCIALCCVLGLDISINLTKNILNLHDLLS